MYQYLMQEAKPDIPQHCAVRVSFLCRGLTMGDKSGSMAPCAPFCLPRAWRTCKATLVGLGLPLRGWLFEKVGLGLLSLGQALRALNGIAGPLLSLP